MALSYEEALAIKQERMDSKPTISYEEAKQIKAEREARKVAQNPNSKEAQNILSNFARAYAFMQGGKQEEGQLASGAVKLAAAIPDSVLGTNLRSKVPNNLAGAPSAFDKEIMGAFPNSATAGKGVGLGLSSIAMGGFGTPGVAADIAMVGYDALPLAGKIAGQVGEQVVKGGIASPIYDQDAPLNQSIGEGMLVGAAAKPAEFALNKGVEGYQYLKGASKKAIAKTKKFLGGGQYTPEEMEKNLQAAKNIGVENDIGLGEVAGSPHMRHIQASMASIPGSGQAPRYMRIGNKLKDTVDESLKDMSPEDINLSKLSNNVVSQYRKIIETEEKKRRELFKIAKDASQEAGVAVHPENYIKNAQAKLSQVSEHAATNKEFKDVYNPDLIDTLNQAIGKEPLSFDAAFDLDKRINTMLKMAYKQGNVADQSILESLKKGINADIDNAALNNGKQDVVNKWLDAKEHFATKIVPLRSKEISQFTKKGGKRAEKLIPTMLAGAQGKFEQPELLQAFTKYLDQETKQKIGKAYLAKGVRELMGDPDIEQGKILKVYQGLGDNIKKELFSPSQINKLDSAVKIQKLVNLDLDQLTNQKTGISKTRAMGQIAGGFIVPGMLSNLATRQMAKPSVKSGYLKAVRDARAKIPKPEKSDINLQSPAILALLNSSSG